MQVNPMITIEKKLRRRDPQAYPFGQAKGDLGGWESPGNTECIDCKWARIYCCCKPNPFPQEFSNSADPSKATKPIEFRIHNGRQKVGDDAMNGKDQHEKSNKYRNFLLELNLSPKEQRPVVTSTPRRSDL